VPKIKEISQTGVMTVDFDPPLAKVPNEWEKYFDKSSWNDFTDKERE